MSRKLVNQVWAAMATRADLIYDLGTLPDLVENAGTNPAMDSKNMVIFGRRGAGKTHTLLDLARRVRARGDVAVFIDMRRISSNSGIYNDSKMAFGNRATNILVDVIRDIHSELYRLGGLGESAALASHLGDVGPALDELERQITDVRVTGEITRTQSLARKGASKIGERLGNKLGVVPTVQVRGEASAEELGQSSETARGEYHAYIHLGSLDRAVRSLVEAMGGARLWVLVDEWSEGVPYDLQPVLADMLRRTFMRVGKVTVKIAAIEHRSRFLEVGKGGSRVGLKLGSDTAENLDLDAALAITTDPRAVIPFIRNILTEHYLAQQESTEGARSDPQIDPVSTSFSSNSFEALVLASEGNPRDALNLAAKAARRAGDGVIGLDDVLRGSSDYFWHTKYKNIEGIPDLTKTFAMFMNLSRERQRRTVLFPRQSEYRAHVDALYDARLLHLLRSGLLAPDGEGMFDAYAVDFGSYAELILSRAMSWRNDGWFSMHSFTLNSDAESWEESIVRKRRSSRKAR